VRGNAGGRDPGLRVRGRGGWRKGGFWGKVGADVGKGENASIPISHQGVGILGRGIITISALAMR
jgi:hypothetical protein